jgi:hypothetical protein
MGAFEKDGKRAIFTPISAHETIRTIMFWRETQREKSMGKR